MIDVIGIAHHKTRWQAARRWLQILRRRLRARPEKLLRLTETLSLGERRFIAVVEFQRQKFLIGGTASSVNLLARLGDKMFQAAPPRTEQPWDELWP